MRRFLIANTAWEGAFAGARTFVVLYLTVGLGQPLGTTTAVLAAVAAGYIVAAAGSGFLGDRFGLSRVIAFASVVYGLGLLLGGFGDEWQRWYLPVIFLVSIAGGTVMTLAWGLLFKLMPPADRGAISGLATTTKGIGLLIGPLLAGAAIDILSAVPRRHPRLPGALADPRRSRSCSRSRSSGASQRQSGTPGRESPKAQSRSPRT